MKSSEILQEVNKNAALKASNAMTRLTGEKVVVDIFEADVKRIEEVKPVFAREEVVTGVYLPVTGDVKGATFLVFPKEVAFKLSDLLVRRPQGTTKMLSELDRSALKEVGNIISGNYLTELSNHLQVKLVEHVPDINVDMFGSLLDQVTSKLIGKAQQALVVEVLFKFKSLPLEGKLMLLFEIEDTQAILKALDADD